VSPAIVRTRAGRNPLASLFDATVSDVPLDLDSLGPGYSPPCNFRRAEIRDKELFKLPGNKASPFGTINCMDRYVSVFVLCLIARLVFGMGSTSSGGMGSTSSGMGSTSSGMGPASSGVGPASSGRGSSRAVKLYDRGVRAMTSKKFAEAQAWFAHALTENPRFAEAHIYLGYLLEMQGSQNYLMALEHYNRAIQLKPNLAVAYEYRGVLLVKMDRKSVAKKDLATLKTLNPELAVELERAMKRGKEANG
jgi:tetratricopeptide (TPR) repeat protein